MFPHVRLSTKLRDSSRCKLCIPIAYMLLPLRTHTLENHTNSLHKGRLLLSRDLRPTLGLEFVWVPPKRKAPESSLVCNIYTSIQACVLI